MLSFVDVTTGKLFTIIIPPPILEQPCASDERTVYDVVFKGETETDAPLRFPGCQSKVTPPFACNVPASPLQIVSPITEITGKGFTVIVEEDVFEQPFASVPVTEYVLVFTGV